MRFEWDAEKNQGNIRKHGFDFADAEEIFAHPYYFFAKGIAT